MKRYFTTLYILIGLMFLLAAVSAFAQTARTVTIGWSLPTTATDGSALTGVQALTKVQVFLGTTTISSTATPTVELTNGTATTTNQTFSVPVGGSLFARVKACNAVGCSDFSSEVKKDFPATVPNPPTNLQVTINLVLSRSGDQVTIRG